MSSILAYMHHYFVIQGMVYCSDNFIFHRVDSVHCVNLGAISICQTPESDGDGIISDIYITKPKMCPLVSNKPFLQWFL